MTHILKSETYTSRVPRAYRFSSSSEGESDDGCSDGCVGMRVRIHVGPFHDMEFVVG